MTKKKTRRLYLTIGVFAFAAAAVGLTLNALKGSITYFYLPSDIAAMASPPTSPVRLGGLVEMGSIKYADAANPDSRKPTVSFNVNDGANSVPVMFTGLLPDLFREGQGVIVQGRFVEGGKLLRADNVLAKHDENYMPKEVADALKEQGLWVDEAKKAAGAQ